MEKSGFRQQLKEEFDLPRAERRWGSGWFTGVLGLLTGIAGMGIVCCMVFPDLLTVPELRPVYASVPVRMGLQGLLIVSYVCSVISLVLREKKLLGFTGLALSLSASVLGNVLAPTHLPPQQRAFFGLDFFMLNVVFTGVLFVPLERLRPLRKEQVLFRTEWREDLFYYFISSMLVQVATFLSLFPSQFIVTHTHWTAFREMVGNQPFLLQLLEIMVLTDFVQYWCHRTFHKVPWMWRFHSVHHSSQALDWIAGARMHFLEILILRGLTVIPMRVLGFEMGPVHAYLLIVYFYSTFIHANIQFSPKWLEKWLVTPRFHHWHHGIEREAIDVNFAIHFPWLDRLFGTSYMPGDQWPSGYGIVNNPVPQGYLQQFLYPFRKRKPKKKP